MLFGNRTIPGTALIETARNNRGIPVQAIDSSNELKNVWNSINILSLTIDPLNEHNFFFYK